MAVDICTRIGRRIRALRTARKWSQTLLADHSGLAREHISEIERGRKEVGIRTLHRISQALEVTLSKFFEGL